MLNRASSYIGVLIDDLVTKGTNEPYRMFTSRVEYRLMLREDNADLRLSQYGYEVGLISQKELHRTQQRQARIDEAIRELHNIKVKPAAEINRILEGLNTSALDKAISAAELLKRPQVGYSDLKRSRVCGAENLSDEEGKTVELLVKYDGFIKRQIADIKRMEEIEKIRISPAIDFSSISGLSREIIEKLSRIKPVSLGQASRISGVTPAAIMLLMVYIKKLNSRKDRL
jgi:tRNA uridine 5-carboxymethylaminomethyl modification enzyme